MRKLGNEQEQQHHNTNQVMDPIPRRLIKAFNRAGQGMTEYILIIGLIALLVFAGVKLFGTNLSDVFTSANNDLANIKNDIPKD